MKRFTNVGRNDQEGRELIPAHRNAEEEEAPLGLSFEGVAGARTLSRRQALGLLGGSLAGASLLSLGLAVPAKAALPFGHGDRITLECLGGPENVHFFLDGRTAEGNVGLAPTTGGVFTGTRWEVIFVTSPSNDEIHLRCLGTTPGNRWLDGRTADGGVGLAPTTGGVFTGTFWQASLVTGNDITLKCLGRGVEGNRWLVGHPQDRTVGLAPQPGSQETKWRVRILNQ
jgi:hypothetical protein